MSARIIAVADVFDALTTERVYKRAMPADDARQLIVREAGKHFDPVIVEAFERQWDDFARLAVELSDPQVNQRELAEVSSN